MNIQDLLSKLQKKPPAHVLSIAERMQRYHTPSLEIWAASADFFFIDWCGIQRVESTLQHRLPYVPQ